MYFLILGTFKYIDVFNDSHVMCQRQIWTVHLFVLVTDYNVGAKNGKSLTKVYM